MEPAGRFCGAERYGSVDHQSGDVRVKGPLGAHFELSVNGQRIAEPRSARRAAWKKPGVLAWEYIGVDLRPDATS